MRACACVCVRVSVYWCVCLSVWVFICECMGVCVDLALVETLLYSVRVCVSVWVFVSAWVCVCMYECVYILLSHCAARDVPIYLHSVCVFVAHIMYAYMYTFIYVNVSIHFAYCVCVFRASFRIISVHIFTHASHQVGSLRDRFPRTVSIIAVTDDVYLCTLFVYLSVHTSKKKKLPNHSSPL